MADSMFHQPVMGRRAFVGGTLAASSMAFLAACGKKGGDPSGSESGSKLNFYSNHALFVLKKDWHADNQMKTSISARFWVFYVILFFNQCDVILI